MKDPFDVIDLLVADRNTVFRFFFLFSRFEYALKRSGCLKEQERAEADWDLYAESIRGRFQIAGESAFGAACTYLRDQPPNQQIVVNDQLGWKGIGQGQGESTERYILRLVQTVRNNLFHGGKYPDPVGRVSDVGRNSDLLNAAIAVIEECLVLSPGLEETFERAA